MIIPLSKQECTTCGAVFTTAAIENQERFWVENPLGLFVCYPQGLGESGRSYDQVCPTCGAINPFEPFDPENDPLATRSPSKVTNP